MLRRRLMKNGGINIDPITGRGFAGDYEVVDLGLPSGLLWATCNVGANEETDYGDYYLYGKGSQKPKAIDTTYNGTEDPLASSADTATQVMGSEWRMPTRTELQDLINNTDYEWITDFNGSGIKGCKFTSKINSNAYVFFPAAGQYRSGQLQVQGDYSLVWSSTPVGAYEAYYLTANKSNKKISEGGRYYGYSVRGVISGGR